MQNKTLSIHKIVPAIGLLLALGACSPGHSDHSGHESHDHEPHAHQPVAEDDHGDEGLILLSPVQLEKLEVAAETVSPGEFSEIVKVSGEISAMPGSEGAVAARQSGIVKLAPGISAGVTVAAGRTVATVSAKGMSGGDQNEAARVAYNAAKRELDRITPLHKEGIVSTRDYNAALQRVEETRAAMGGGAAGGSTTATAPVGGVITSVDVVDGQYVDAGQTIASISSNNALTLRADLPESAVGRLDGISDARFRTAYSDDVIDVVASGGRMLSKPTVSSASGGYIPVYFSIPRTNGNIINGTYCEVYLLGASRDGVLTVAEAAVSEQQGRYFVYVEKSPGHYEKRPVEIGQTDGTRREVLSGLQPGERVVCKGMTFVRLAETSGVVPEGHSHSH